MNTEPTREHLVQKAAHLDAEISRLNGTCALFEPGSKQRNAIKAERAGLIAQRLEVTETLQALKAEKKAANLQGPDKCTLLVLEMEGRRFYHAVRDTPSAWAVNAILDLGVDAPLILNSFNLSLEQAEALPPEIFDFPA